MFGTGTTLRYTPTLSGVKEDVILDAYRGQNTFAFTLSTGSLSVFEENGQYFIADNAEAEGKILISETWVYDSADHFEKGTLTVTPVKAGLYLLTVGASVDFLTDSKTVYPVYIDPTLTVNSGNDYIEDATVFEGKPDTKYGTDTQITVGRGSATLGVGRAMVRLPGLYDQDFFAELLPGNIFSVKFTITPGAPTASRVLNVHALNGYSWQENTVTWNVLNGIGYDSAVQSSVTVGSSAVSFDITNLAKAWCYSDFDPASGFMIKAVDETLVKRFYSSEGSATTAPYVTMTYLENGVYRIKNMNSSLFMQTVGAKSKDQTRVFQMGVVNTDPDRLSQLWKVAALEDGTFSVRPMHDPTMGLSVFTNASGQQLVGIRPIVLSDTASLLDDTAQWRIAPTSNANGLSIRTNDTAARALRAEDDSTQAGKHIVTGVYSDYYPDSWLFEEVTDVTPGVLLYDTTTGMRLDTTVERTLIKDTTATLEDYNIKAVYYSPNSVTQQFSYSSGDPNILTVDSYDGTISGISDGIASVSVSSGEYSKSFSLRVLPFANGVYFIENKEYPGYYVQGDDDYSDENLTGEILELREFSGASRQQWTLTHVGGGYYKLATVGGVLSVNSEYLHEEDEALIIDSDLGLDRQKWKITQTDNGSFKIKAKSSDSYTTTDLAMVCGTRAASVTNGVDVEQREFMGENDSYKDEWRFFRIEFASSTPLEGQEMGLWCWVTTAKMFARNYYPSITATQADAVRNVKGSVMNVSGGADEIIEAINYYVSTVSDETMDLVYYQYCVYSQNTLIQFLNDGNVVGVAIGEYKSSAANRNDGHAVLIYGYVTVDSDIYFLVKDPSPVGDGDIYMISYEDLYCETKVNGDETFYYVWETAIVTRGLYSGQTIPYYYGE